MLIYSLLSASWIFKKRCYSCLANYLIKGTWCHLFRNAMVVITLHPSLAKKFGFFSIRNPQREQAAQCPKRCFSWFFYVEMLMIFIWPCNVVELSWSIWRHGLQWHSLSSSGRIFLNTMILGTVTLTVSKLEALRCKNGCFCYMYMEFIFHLGFFFINSLEKNPSQKNAYGYYVATNILQFLT